MTRFGQVLLSIVLIWVAAPVDAAVDLIELPAEGIQRTKTFVREFEKCFPVKPGQVIVTGHRSEEPVDFDIHYHETDSSVMTPVDRPGLAALDVKYVADKGRDYCIMWRAKSRRRVAINFWIQVRDAPPGSVRDPDQ